jgi:nitrite reductase/ring-hydroxylating ferredoxin subunit
VIGEDGAEVDEPRVVSERRTARVATWSEVPDRVPVGAMVEGIHLVLVRQGDDLSVLYGRSMHRVALLADGHVEGDDLICGLHGWDYRIDSGVSAHNNFEKLEKFTRRIDDDGGYVDAIEVTDYLMRHPQPFDPDVYQGYVSDPHMVVEEPFVGHIHELATNGLTKTGPHGSVSAMGASREQLPTWDHIQFVTAQLARLPMLGDVDVATGVCIGPNADNPLWLDIPIFVSDMSYGAPSREAKTALARTAELAGSAICSGEVGMLPEEQAESSRYFSELASARFGWSWDALAKVQAFHLKGGQGAKTGTGGHLPGDKVVGRIAEVRERSGGISIGFKLSAQHIEDDSSVPTIPALARAQAHLDRLGRRDVSLVITGGLRHAPDFAKALAMGAESVAVANSAIQANIGCSGHGPSHRHRLWRPRPRLGASP